MGLSVHACIFDCMDDKNWKQLKKSGYSDPVFWNLRRRRWIFTLFFGNPTIAPINLVSWTGGEGLFDMMVFPYVRGGVPDPASRPHLHPHPWYCTPFVAVVQTLWWRN